MSVRASYRLDCNRMLIPRRWPQLAMTMWTRGRHYLSTRRQIKSDEPPKWSLNVDIEFAKDEGGVPLAWFTWQVLLKKFSLWKFKLLCDAQFDEKVFLPNSKLAVVLLMKYIMAKDKLQIAGCTTPMGYKQVLHDLIHTRSDKNKLLRFEERHIVRAIPMQIRYLPNYEQNFGFIDVIFLAFRRADDFACAQQAQEIRRLIFKHPNYRELENPIIYAELFARFRRDYSLPATVHAGNWLIATLQPLRLDMLSLPVRTMYKMPKENDAIHANAVYS